jgi:hypothetical protein
MGPTGRGQRRDLAANIAVTEPTLGRVLAAWPVRLDGFL